MQAQQQSAEAECKWGKDEVLNELLLLCSAALLARATFHDSIALQMVDLRGEAGSGMGGRAASNSVDSSAPFKAGLAPPAASVNRPYHPCHSPASPGCAWWQTPCPGARGLTSRAEQGRRALRVGAVGRGRGRLKMATAQLGFQRHPASGHAA